MPPSLIDGCSCPEFSESFLEIAQRDGRRRSQVEKRSTRPNFLPQPAFVRLKSEPHGVPPRTPSSTLDDAVAGYPASPADAEDQASLNPNCTPRRAFNGKIRVLTKTQVMNQAARNPYPAPSTENIAAMQSSAQSPLSVDPAEWKMYLEFQQLRETFNAFLQNQEEVAEFMSLKQELKEYMAHKQEIQTFLQSKSSTSSEGEAAANPPEKDDDVGNNMTPMDEDKGNDGEWQPSRRRKHRSSDNAQNTTSHTAPTQTVVLKPTCKAEVYRFTGRDICAAIEKTGVRNKDGFSVHMSEKSNTISITTKNPLITSKLLSIGEIKKDDKTYEVTPYMAMASNQVKGVIYLHGSDNKETPETLMQDLMCRTNKIVAARVIGRSGRTVLITFEGKSIPKYVRFLYESYPVSSYRPRPVVCFNCHEIGHKSDVCPNKTSRCDKCGHDHSKDSDCELQPKCHNCGGSHVATSNDCPKRRIPPKRRTTHTATPPQENKTNKPAPTKGAPGPSPVIPTTPSKGAWSTPLCFTDTGAPVVLGMPSNKEAETPSATVELAIWQSKVEARMTSVETSIKEMKQMLGTLLSKLNV